MLGRPFTSGALGFLIGFSIAGTLGVYYMQQEYRAASNSVMASSARLTHSAQNVTGYLDRIQDVEARMNQLEKGVVSRKQFDDAAESLRKLYTDMFEETHELRKQHETFATRKHHDAPSWAPPLEDRVRLPPVRII
ncbi:hypothetical protein CBS9595_002320 [Malassezia furfur]|nr:hypothetical protein CBS9595_002320 [Malassezia furfur]